MLVAEGTQELTPNLGPSTVQVSSCPKALPKKERNITSPTMDGFIAYVKQARTMGCCLCPKRTLVR